MRELLTHLPILVVGASLLSAAVVGGVVYSVLWNRRNAYVSSRFQEVGEVEDTIERQKQEKAALEATVNQLKEELARLGEKRDQLDKLHAELTDVEQRLLASRDALEQAYKAKAELAVAQSEMEHARVEKSTLLEEMEALSARRTELEETVRRFESQYQTAKNQIDQTTGTLATLQAQVLAAQSEHKACREQMESCRAKEEVSRKAAEEATQKLSSLEAEIHRLKEVRDTLERTGAALNETQQKVQSAERMLSGLEKEIDRSKSELKAVQKTIAGQESERAEAEATKKEVAELRQEKERLMERRCEEEVALQKVAAEVLRLKGTLDKTDDQAPDEDLKTSPEEVFQSAPPVELCRESEQNMLTDFIAKLGEAGLVFNRRTVNSFHTALKCQDINPLTVLAGVSGTGKTLLPIQYARYFGMMQLVISVQPRWDSPQDLFGFYNYLERKYKATDLSRLLWSYQNRKEYADLMSIVLFDEMNLARTEYYFSDFLSKLELRRLKSNNANIQIDIPRARVSLPVPPNMLMVGTMNEDESTQTLSDKVLDRANVLRFGRPASERKSSVKTHTVEFSGRTVTKKVWNEWISGDKSLDGAVVNQVARWIDDLNEALEGLGRPFGYRVQEAMMEYVRQYPERSQYRWAFADQIEQKILPKIRGVDTNTGNYATAMAKISGIIAETQDKALLEAFDQANREANNQGLFVWSGVSRWENDRS